MLHIRNLFCTNHSINCLITVRFNHRNLGVGNSWKGKSNIGRFYRELPENVKPTHIIVGAGSAGCVLVF